MIKIATGTDDFRKLREGNKYYIDKTLMIKEFIDYDDEVALITRPRRFGKTLNMTMLREFFDQFKQSAVVFDGLAIMDTEYADQINTRPVIYLTFKNCSGSNIVALKKRLAKAMWDEYNRYLKLLENFADPEDGDYYIFYQVYKMFKEVFRFDEVDEKNNGAEVEDKIDDELLKSSLKELIRVASVFYGKRVLLLIDEYDQPLIEAHEGGFRENFSKDIYADFLGDALKSNDFLGQALLTGIQRVAKESIFSKLNNFTVYPVTDEIYAPYFGLTEAETKVALEAVGLALTDEVKSYYDGYVMGGVCVYNPWSILKYMRKKKLEPFWVKTSTNRLIKETIPTADADFKEAFEQLILDGEVEVSVNLEASFLELATTRTLWGLLINSGYLTVIKEYRSSFKRIIIPNEEVKEEFREIVATYTRLNADRLDEMFNALFDGRMDHFLKVYQKLVYDYLSVHDIKKQTGQALPEASYHNFFLGMAISTEGMYESTSNLEAGDGRGDITMISLQPNLRPHIIIEFKRGEDVEKLRQEALDQIFEKKYYIKLSGRVLCVGIAHNKKKCEIVSKEISADEFGEI